MKLLASIFITVSLFFALILPAQAADPKPAPAPIQASPSALERVERIRAYFAAFGASTDPLVRLDVARLRLIYDPATRDFFTPAQRQVAELVILRRDAETGKLLPISQLPALAAEHYGITIGKPSIFGHWKNFIERVGDIPAIRAEQEAMRRVILSNASLTPAERDFALITLTTLKDGVPPAIEKTAKATGFAKGKVAMYDLIERQRIAYDAMTRPVMSPGVPGPVMIHQNFAPILTPTPLISPMTPIGISGR